MQALLTIALPVFGIVFAGYVVGRLGRLGEHSSQRLNRFSCCVAPPAMTQQYGVHVERTSSAIIATTVLSVLTVPSLRALLGLG